MKNLPIVICFICSWACDSLKADPNPWKYLSLELQVDSLISSVKKFRDKNHDSTIFYAGQLRQRAEEVKDDKAMALSLQELAWAHKHKRELAQSIWYYFELERLYKQSGNRGGLGTANFNIAQIFARAHEYDKAIRYLEQAKDHYEAAAKPYNVSKALYAMAMRYIEKKEPNTAKDLLLEALEVCPENKFSHKSMIYTQLGWAAKDLGEHVKARGYYRKSLSGLDHAAKWDKKKAIAYNNIGESYLLEGLYDSATYYFHKAMKIKDRLNDPGSSMETLTQLARLACQHGDTDGALRLLEQGMTKVDPNILNEKLGDALALASSIANDPAVPRLPYATLVRYMDMQQRQFKALQDLKKALDRSSRQHEIQIGVNRDAHQQKTRTLEASLMNKTNTVAKQQHTVTGVLAFVVVVLMIVVIFGRKVIRGERKRLQGKTRLERDMMKEHDYKTLQLMIIKAEYEEIIRKLKDNPGLKEDGSVS